MKNNTVKNNTNYIVLTTILIFSAICLLISLGQIFVRWDFLQQINMADRFLSYGSLYPVVDYDSFLDGGVSGYFPGLSLIVILIGDFLRDDILIYIFSIFSIIITLLFFYSLAIITNKISKYHDTKYIFIFIIGFSCLFLEDYLFYALEFKPDTIALTIGLYSLIYSGLLDKSQSSLQKLILTGFICGSAIIFKQQYLSFIFGFIVYSLLNFTKENIIFALSSLFGCFAVFYFFSYIDNIWYWTFEIYKDDGFMSIKSFLQMNQVLIRNTVLFFLILYFFYGKYNLININLDRKYFFKIYRFFTITPFPIILISSSLAAILSGLKLGGNSGNIGLAILLSMPVCFFLIDKLNLKLILLITFLSLIFILPSGLNTFKNYFSYKDISYQIENINFENFHDNKIKILSGSDLYGVVRKLKQNKEIADYWTLNTQKNKQAINEAIKRYNYDLLLIETHSFKFIDQIYFKDKYKIVFKNEIGVLAMPIQ